jgi:hypothetical protein
MMQDPTRLRVQAALCREMSAKRGTHLYLLQLAERLEGEAGEIESRMAGQKPSVPPAKG